MSPFSTRALRPPTSVNGPDSVFAANKMRSTKSRMEQWPYPWTYPPPNAKNAMPSGSIPAPLANEQAAVLTYKVPTGMRFYLVGIIQQFAGVGFVAGSPSAVWTLDKDSPVTSGITPIQSSPIAFFTRLPFTLGSFDSGPFLLGMPEIFEANTVIRSKVVTDGSITPGGSNWFTTLLMGWTTPAE